MAQSGKRVLHKHGDPSLMLASMSKLDVSGVLVTPAPGRQKQGQSGAPLTSQPPLPAHVCTAAHTVKAGPAQKHAHAAATAFSHGGGVHIQTVAGDTPVPVSTGAGIFYLLYFKVF